MNVLTVNCGSSSIKIQLCRIDDAGLTKVAGGAVEALGPEARLVFGASDGAPETTRGAIVDHATALRMLLDRFSDDLRRSIDALGHRVVQGGEFTQTVIIDDAVVRAIEAGRRLAPLHNGPSLEGVLAAREELPGVPMVAVFDTTFHLTLPSAASHYALPQELALKHGLRRYGYHGIAHRSMAERYAELAGAATQTLSLVTLQLGNGCSATAIKDGVSVDTSMGFTPLEGLVMGTRPGDIDAGALTYLLREGLTPDDLDRILNHDSGLLGVSGTTGDMATLLEEEAQGRPRAHEAIELFCYRARKYIGAYFAVLGRTAAIVFGGGIGERSPEIRRRICEPLAPLGVHIDPSRNAELVGVEGAFSTRESLIAAWVIPSDEESIIAKEAFELLSRSAPQRN